MGHLLGSSRLYNMIGGVRAQASLVLHGPTGLSEHESLTLPTSRLTNDRHWRRSRALGPQVAHPPVL